MEEGRRRERDESGRGRERERGSERASFTCTIHCLYGGDVSPGPACTLDKPPTLTTPSGICGMRLQYDTGSDGVPKGDLSRHSHCSHGCTFICPDWLTRLSSKPGGMPESDRSAFPRVLAPRPRGRSRRPGHTPFLFHSSPFPVTHFVFFSRIHHTS